MREWEFKMKWILCISRVNFLPDNGLLLIQELLQKPGSELMGVIVVENRNPKNLFKALVATCLGARRTAGALVRHALSPDPRLKLLRQAQIPWISVKSVNDPKALTWLHTQNQAGVQIGIHVRTRCIFGTEALQSLPLWMNMHHGLLPKWKGTSCDLHMLVQTGQGALSLHQMQIGVDQGPIASTYVGAPTKPKDYAGMILGFQKIEAEMIHSWILDQGSGHPSPLQANEDPNPHWCRTPGPKQIRQLIQQGYLL